MSEPDIQVDCQDFQVGDVVQWKFNQRRPTDNDHLWRIVDIDSKRDQVSLVAIKRFEQIIPLRSLAAIFEKVT